MKQFNSPYYRHNNAKKKKTKRTVSWYEYKLKYDKKWRKKNKEKIAKRKEKKKQYWDKYMLKYGKKYYNEHKEEKLKRGKPIQKKWRIKNRIRLKKKHKQYRIDNINTIRNREKRRVVELTDGYIAEVLGIKLDDIKKYPQLIEAKRIQLKLHRKANQKHKS